MSVEESPKCWLDIWGFLKILGIGIIILFIFHIIARWDCCMCGSTFNLYPQSWLHFIFYPRSYDCCACSGPGSEACEHGALRNMSDPRCQE